VQEREIPGSWALLSTIPPRGCSSPRCERGWKREVFPAQNRPESGKSGGITRGFRNRRSPPVSISGTRNTDLPVLTSCTETPPGNIKNVRRLDDRHPLYSPRDQHFLHKTVHDGQTYVHHFQRSDSGKQKHHFAQHTVPIGYTRGVTLRLSNLSVFLTGKSRDSCAEFPSIFHTFEVPERLKPLLPAGFSSFWAQAVITGHLVGCWELCTDRRCTREDAGIPRVVRWCIYPGGSMATMVGRTGIQGGTTHHARRGTMPTMLPRVHTHRCAP